LVGLVWVGLDFINKRDPDSKRHAVFRIIYVFFGIFIVETGQAPPLKNSPTRLQDTRVATTGTQFAGTPFLEVDASSAHSSAWARFFCEPSEDPANRIFGVVAAIWPG
jgi:hypothetical protein